MFSMQLNDFGTFMHAVSYLLLSTQEKVIGFAAECAHISNFYCAGVLTINTSSTSFITVQNVWLQMYHTRDFRC